MIRALWRAGASVRLGMVISILVICVLARISAVWMPDGQWVGSERQGMYGIVVLWLVLPVYVAMLGAALLRGEHASWSWGLARPVSRARLLGSMLALDAITIATCVGVAAVVLEGFGGASAIFDPTGAWVSIHGIEWGDTAPGLLAPTWAALYLATATAGAWTSSSVRAAAAAVAVLGATAGVLSWLAYQVVAFQWLHVVQFEWAFAYLEDAMPISVADLGMVEPLGLALLGLGLAGATIPIGATLGFLRAAAVVPARPRWATVLAPTLVAGTVSAALVGGAMLSLWILAPSQAQVGRTRVDVELVADPSAPAEIVDVRLRYDSGLPHHRSVSWRAVRSGGRQTAWTVADISPGEVLACAILRPPGEHGRRPAPAQEACSPATITDVALQTVTIDLRTADRRPFRIW